MRNVWKFELRRYFLTPVGYVFIVIFWVLSAAFFFLYNVLRGTSDLTELFGNLNYLFMMIVPLLTMRLWSAERRQRTDQLLYCTPTPLTAIVMGKFLAAVSMMAVALAGTGIYIVVLARYAALQPGMIAVHYLGFFLLAACYISVGVLMSALTESQVVAAVLTFAANMLLQLAEMAAPSVHIPYLPFVPGLLQALALNAHYARFTSGVVSPADIGYFGLFLTVTLSLTVCLLRGQHMRRR